MTRPNVIVIITDQQRADVSAREGYPLDVTPFVDALAAQGAWFSRAYTTAPVCSPARTSMLTGRYPSAHRVTQNAVTTPPVSDGNLYTSAREAGYATALIGKNHTFLCEDDADCFIEFSHGGQRSGPRTVAEGEFDAWLTGLSHRTALSPAPGGAEVQNPHRIVSHAIEWVDSLAVGQPFMMQISFPEPHNPYQVPEEYFDLFPPSVIPDPRVGEEFLATADFRWQHLRTIGEAGDPGYAQNMPRARSNYLGMLRFIDDQIARLVAHLTERGLLDDTLLIVTSDHGDYFGEYGLVRKGAGVPDILMRIPLVAHGYGVAIRPHAAEACVSLADLLPTVCEVMGVRAPAAVQGRSLVRLFAGSDSSGFDSAYGEQGIGGRRFSGTDVRIGDVPGLPTPGSPAGAPTFDELNAVTQAGRMRMVRRGRWKLIVDSEAGLALHDLEADPSEIVDRSKDPELAETVRELLEVLAQWLIRVEDELPLPDDGYRRLSRALDE